MPIYEYKCKKGHVFEVMQSFSDDSLTECEVCGAPVQKVFHPVAVHFKGSGFHNTDYGTKRRAREGAREGGDSSSGSSSDGAGSGSSSDGAGNGSSSDGAGSSKSDSSSSSETKAA